MNTQHPVRYIGSALALCLPVTALWKLVSGSVHDTGFWQGAAATVLLIIATLSIDLFRRVAKLYPSLNPFRSARH